MRLQAAQGSHGRGHGADAVGRAGTSARRPADGGRHKLYQVLRLNTAGHIDGSAGSQGMDEGVLCAFRGMYGQLKHMFKLKGCLGAWWAATNGVLQGCPLSVIVINALTTTWKRIIDDVKRPVTVTMKELPPAPPVEELPSCYWISYGAGLDQI